MGFLRPGANILASSPRVFVAASFFVKRARNRACFSSRDIDRQGNDRGSLGETWVPASDRSFVEDAVRSDALDTVFCGYLAGLARRKKRAAFLRFHSIQVTAEALAAQPVGANWLSYNGDYTGRRFAISTDQCENVGQLRGNWFPRAQFE